jgi:hypothetical protein
MHIVAQQLSDGNVEVGRMQYEQGHGENGSVDYSGDTSQNFSGNLVGHSGNLSGQSGNPARQRRRPSHGSMGSMDLEMQERKERSQENGEAPLKQMDGFGSRDMSRGRRSSAQRNQEPAYEFALVIDGFSLAFVLDDESLQQEFIKLCKQCVSILCCRVSPRQKAQVTNLVKKGMGENKLCLGIGDGANDVGMIQAANVGVGITGVEGAQVRTCTS